MPARLLPWTGVIATPELCSPRSTGWDNGPWCPPRVRDARTSADLDSGPLEIWIEPTLDGMQIVPISQVKAKLNEYVDSVALTRDQVTITKNGSPAAVLVGADEWESIQETLFWLSQPGIRDAIAEANADVAAGRTAGEPAIRAEFGVPRRDS